MEKRATKERNISDDSDNHLGNKLQLSRRLEPQDDSDNDIPLPEKLREECTQRRLGRIRKKPKNPGKFEFDKL